MPGAREGGEAGGARFHRVEMVVNAASGSVGPDAVEQARAIFGRHGLEAKIASPEPRELEAAIREALSRKPDLLVVLAGDGTARTAASLAGPDGPLVMPLPGGTMNMLPKAVYGERNWQRALEDSLADGRETPIAGGAVDGKPFYVAAIIGSPALWAKAREAVREWRLDLAVMRAQRAIGKAFGSRLRYSFEGGEEQKAEALTLMSPLVSRGVEDNDALEAAALRLRDIPSAARLAARTVWSSVLGDWRKDPTVQIARCRTGRIWAKHRIPALLDGESMRFGYEVDISYRPDAFRAWAPAEEAAEVAETTERAEAAA